MSKLSVVATPIGNLADITFRAVETLKVCDFVICEDTRVTGKLLNHFEIKKEMVSLNAFSEKKNLDSLVSKIQEVQNVCLVSDAGTPGISDPGERLVSLCRKNNIEIEVIPGASALTSALSGSGFDTSSFVFLGFLPKKKGRKTLFEEIKNIDRTVVFYESPHRIMKTLEELENLFEGSSSDVVPAPPHVIPAKAGIQDSKNLDPRVKPKDDDTSAKEGKKVRKIGVYKEITKIHEEFITGSPSEIARYFEENPSKIKGEFVVIIESI